MLSPPRINPTQKTESTHRRQRAEVELGQGPKDTRPKHGRKKTPKQQGISLLTRLRRVLTNKLRNQELEEVNLAGTKAKNLLRGTPQVDLPPSFAKDFRCQCCRGS